MKLWQKEISTSKKVEIFTTGMDRDMDLFLSLYDVQGSIAHITMLESIGLLKSEELVLLKRGLLEIYQEIEDGEFFIAEGIEDVHSQVEFLLTDRLGDIGKKIHSGRSRNDQVLVDSKLYLRDELTIISQSILKLFHQFQSLSNQYQDILIPGYTHTQVAMPSSFGLWFGAYAESLVDDMQNLLSSYKIVNKNPLGSAAGYGSSFPLNREMTTSLLGFDTLNYNVVYAQMTRGRSELCVANSMAFVAFTLNKIASDCCLYLSQNFSFMSFPDELTTGSSIMPHKKNPDVFELIRAKTNRLKSLPNEIMMLTTNMTSGYHRDWQLLKEILFPAIQELKACLDMTSFMFQAMTPHLDIVKDEKYQYLFTVERVNELVLQGVAFRDAYKQVGKEVADSTFKPNYTINHTHEGSIGNLCNEQISNNMNLVIAQFEFEKVEKAILNLLK